MTQPITEFTGEYAFLSNFYECEFRHFGDYWKTVEHCFQAAKMENSVDYFKIRDADTPARAKKYGREGTMRKDWEDTKVNVMRDILRSKFAVREMGIKLLATGDSYLIEGNRWKDFYWGVDLATKEGKNMLGLLLMEVRKLIVTEVQEYT